MWTIPPNTGECHSGCTCLFQSCLTLHTCLQDVKPHQLIWRELEVSTHLLKTRGIDPVDYEEDGYVGDVVFQPPHTFQAVNRGLGDIELHPHIRQNEEVFETRRSLSSGGWTNDDFHRDADVQNVSDDMMFMFDIDADQPDEHFCHGPLPPSELPDIVLAPPPEICSDDAHSGRIPSFGGELIEQREDLTCQVAGHASNKTSIKGELPEGDANEEVAVNLSSTDAHGSTVCFDL